MAGRLHHAVRVSRGEWGGYRHGVYEREDYFEPGDAPPHPLHTTLLLKRAVVEQVA